MKIFSVRSIYNLTSCTSYYYIDGEYSISELLQNIKRIVPYVIKNVAERTKRLIEVMKIKCWTNTPKTGENRTHLKNDTLIFDN